MNEITRPIEVITQEINFYKSQAGNAIIEIGKRLHEAKLTLPHGAWGAWLQNEVEFSERTAQNFMRIAKEYRNPQLIADMGNSATKALLLLSLPAEEREEFVGEAHEIDGEEKTVADMTTKEMERLLKELEAERAEKEKLQSQLDLFQTEKDNAVDAAYKETEDKLEAFKRNAGLTNIGSDAQLAVEGNAEYERKRVENGTQINLIRDLTKYINNPSNEYEVLPANIGLSDNGLTTQIDRYNELIFERKRLLRTSTENNPMIVNLDTSIRAMKANVKAAIDGTLQGLLIVKADLDREASRFSRRISDAPGQERQYVSIARQQEIKAGLYLMLLQKREENAITLAATANNAKIIDEPAAEGGPVSPKPKMIYMVALAVGLGLPVGFIFLLGLTKFKIEGRGDVEKLTRLPIVGDVPLTDEKTGSITVFENQNTLMSETFRNVRTNLQFMLESSQKVILVTSTVSGEGKSFISANLAISLSLLGKKVVIVGLDIRKPGLNKIFNIPRKEMGITQYLSNPEKNLMDFVQSSDVSKNLYIIPGGTVPPNPTELLARDGLDKAIAILRKEFDYVILDTAPVGMVTDTLLIGRIADLSVYVCRADYTRKAEFTLINELADNNKLPNLCTVINGLDLQKKKYGYYYGYGKYSKYYGYGKRYGYGYGYGEHRVKEE